MISHIIQPAGTAVFFLAAASVRVARAARLIGRPFGPYNLRLRSFTCTSLTGSLTGHFMTGIFISTSRVPYWLRLKVYGVQQLID